MPSIIIRNPKVGEFTDETDYNRRHTAYRQMYYWWGRLLVQWGLRTGRITKPSQGDFTNLMKATISIALTIMLLLFAYAAIANSIGFTYSQIIDDRSLGATGDYQTALADRVNFEADAQVQAGDVYNATINTNFIFDISTIDLKLLIANKLKGYTLDTLGRSQSLGLALTVPIDNLNVDIGIGGASASPFSAPNAYDTLTGAGFAESDINGKGLTALTPSPKGIPFKNGSSLNAFLSTGFTKGIFDIDLKGTIELLGEGDKMHQLNSIFKTSGTIYGALITTALEVGLASYQQAIHYETAVITSAGFDF